MSRRFGACARSEAIAKLSNVVNSADTPTRVFNFAPRALVLAVHFAAIGGLMAATGVASPVYAQDVQAREYNIPAGSLATALNRFADESGILMTSVGELTKGRTTPGLKGRYTVQAGFATLLSGSGLDAFRQADGSYGLRAASQGSSVLPAVTVTAKHDANALPAAYAGGQVARGGRVGMLGNKDAMDTPFSVINYTNKTIVDQQAQTVQDVLMNVSSILTKQNSASDEDGSITIRGYSNTLSAGTGSLNGLAGMAPLRTPDMDYMERVEVLLGPSALLNGMAASGAGGIGGSYNLVTKKAGDVPVTALTTRYASRSQFGAHLDVGRRFGEEKQFGVRFNGGYRKGDTAVEPVTAEAGLGALNLDYRGERVRISADIAHQSNEASPQAVQQIVLSGVGGGFAHVPKAPDASRSLNPTWSKQPSKLTLAMLQGEVDITDTITAYAAIGKQKLDLSLLGPNQPKLLDASGTFGWNNVEHTNLSWDVLSMQAGLRALATTGSVNHALSLNLSKSTMETGEAQRTTPFAYTTNLYNPVFGAGVFAGDPGDPKKLSETRVSSIGIADTLSMFDERVLLTAGVRHQDVEADSFNGATGAKTSSYKSDAWTPSLGLVVKPWQKNVSLYTNYIENLERGTIVGTSFANRGEILAPYVSKQQEVGAKVDWGTVTTTLAAFQIAKPNVITTAANMQKLDGEVRNRGVELSAYGELTRGVRMMGGVTYIDSEQTKTQGGLSDGNRESGIPKVRTVVSGEWDTPFLQGLTLSGRFTYTGDQLISSSNNNLKIPSWTLFDLGARYVFKPGTDKPITLRFNVDNVFDKDYWSSSNFRYVQLGAPRTYRLSATFNF